MINFKNHRRTFLLITIFLITIKNSRLTAYQTLTIVLQMYIIHLTIRLIVKGGQTMGLQQTLKALADPIRREILNILKKGRMSAGEITDHFSVTAPSISRHLSVLKDADLIRDTREGKFIFYEINTSVLEETLLWIADLKGDNDNA